jgi:hypothetical protein
LDLLVATALDLNISYYHIKLDADTKKLLIYKRLIMDITIVLMKLLLKILYLSFFQDVEYVKTYLEELLIVANNCFKDHLIKLEMVLERLSIIGMRMHISISSFFQKE